MKLQTHPDATLKKEINMISDLILATLYELDLRGPKKQSRLWPISKSILAIKGENRAKNWTELKKFNIGAKIWTKITLATLYWAYTCHFLRLILLLVSSLGRHDLVKIVCLSTVKWLVCARSWVSWTICYICRSKIRSSGQKNVW